MEVPKLRVKGWRRAEWALPIATGIALLVLWDLAVRVFDIPFWVLPSPWKTAVAMYNGMIGYPLEKGLMYRAAYYYHSVATLTETFVGWIVGSLIGIGIALSMFQFKIVERAIFPYINGTQALPKIAIAPLFMIWLGLGMSSKIALVITTAFFPVLINTLLGFNSVERERIDLLKALGASQAQIYRMVLIPSALPNIFAGAEVALLFSFISAVAGEFVAAGQGLGLLVVLMGQTLDMAGLFSILILMAVMGWAADALFRKLRDRVCFWAVREQE